MTTVDMILTILSVAFVVLLPLLILVPKKEANPPCS